MEVTKMKYYVDEHIKNTVRVFPEQGRYGYHRYDMNENPEGLPKEFVPSILSRTGSFISMRISSGPRTRMC